MDESASDDSTSTPRVSIKRAASFHDELARILEEHESAIQAARDCMQRVLSVSRQLNSSVNGGGLKERLVLPLQPMQEVTNTMDLEVSFSESSSPTDDLIVDPRSEDRNQVAGLNITNFDSVVCSDKPQKSVRSTPTAQSTVSVNVDELARSGDTTSTYVSLQTSSQLSFMKTCTEARRQLRKKISRDYNRIVGDHKKESKMKQLRPSIQSSEAQMVQQSWCLHNCLFGVGYAQARARKLVDSQYFVIFGRAVVILDALTICSVTVYSLHESIRLYRDRVHSSDTDGEVVLPLFVWYIEVLINVAFLWELVLNISAQGCSRFLRGSDPSWNACEAILVVTSCSEILLRRFFTASAAWIRNFRMLRVVRVLRMLRVFRFAMGFRHLRLITLAVMQSAIPLFWAFTFLVFLLFLFAIIFLQGVTQYIETASPDDPIASDLQHHFGSMPMALLTLFMSISGGINWWEVASPLLEVSMFYTSTFVLYIMVMIFAISNIITGIFVNDALDVAHWDKAIVQQLEKERTGQALRELKELFALADEDDDSILSVRELEKFLRRDDVRAILVTLGLNISDARGFFHLLDVDDSGNVEIDKFVVGCLRLRGVAERIDFEMMRMEQRKLMSRLQESVRRMADHWSRRSSKMSSNASFSPHPRHHISSDVFI